MNAAVYLFGKFNGGYTQYPDDYTSVIFEKFHENAKSITQIAIHRDGDLMYYGYIRNLEEEHYIGMCVVLNGLLVTRIDTLFSLFENTVSELITEGQLIHFNEQGDIVANVDKLFLNREEVDMLSESLRAGFNSIHDVTALPPVSLENAKDSLQSFVIDDDTDKIIKSTHTNGYTFICKSKGYNTVKINAYKRVLGRTNKEKKELLDQLEKLQVEHKRTLRQKKQFKVVLILLVVLGGVSTALFSIHDSLNTTRNALSDANSVIRKKEKSISMLKEQTHDLKNELKLEQEARVKVESELRNLKVKINVRQPFIVKSTSFDYDSGYLTFNYYGLTDTNVKIGVRAYNDYGEHFSSNSNVSIHLGEHSASIYVSRELNSECWYSFEILKENVIVGGDRH